MLKVRENASQEYNQMNSNLFTSRQTEVDNIKKEIFTVDNRKSILSENTRTKSISNNKRIS